MAVVATGFCNLCVMQCRKLITQDEQGSGGKATGGPKKAPARAASPTAAARRKSAATKAVFSTNPGSASAIAAVDAAVAQLPPETEVCVWLRYTESLRWPGGCCVRGGGFAGPCTSQVTWRSRFAHAFLPLLPLFLLLPLLQVDFSLLPEGQDGAAYASAPPPNQGNKVRPQGQGGEGRARVERAGPGRRGQGQGGEGREVQCAVQRSNAVPSSRMLLAEATAQCPYPSSTALRPLRPPCCRRSLAHPHTHPHPHLRPAPPPSPEPCTPTVTRALHRPQPCSHRRRRRAATLTA